MLSPLDCDTKFKKIRGVRGRPCFKINTKNRLLTKLILQDRDKTTETYSGVTINWKNWNNYFADFICRCAKRVKQNGGKVFGIQNYGRFGRFRKGIAT